MASRCWLFRNLCMDPLVLSMPNQQVYEPVAACHRAAGVIVGNFIALVLESTILKVRSSREVSVEAPG